jgi:hypothetical protein
MQQFGLRSITFRHLILTAEIPFHPHFSSFKVSDGAEAPGFPVTYHSIMVPDLVHHLGL